MARSTVLVIDDEPNILTTVRRSLDLEGYQVEVAGGGAAGLAKLAEHDIELVLLDVMMPGETGIEVLPKLRAVKPETIVVMMSGNATIDTAVSATKAGAYDFIEKPLSGDKLLLTVQNALSFARLHHENARLRGRARSDFAMIGKGAAMRAIFDKVAKTAPSTGRVLITGENGTGKELVARAIHEHSKRADGPFVKLNCAAIPSELIESELFGHMKGSFTGAFADRAGKFELADGGTLFLDEIGDFPLPLQAKLLRVLEDKVVRPLGDTRSETVNVRVIAATNRDLRRAVSEGQFREDLFYRLNVVDIHLPPLRERLEDLPLLIQHVLARSAHAPQARRLSEEALRLLLHYPWPGNVRELENTLERALVLCQGEEITPADLPTHLTGSQPQVAGLQAALIRRCTLADLEREYILLALEWTEGKKTEAADLLQIDRKTLYRKLVEYGKEV